MDACLLELGKNSASHDHTHGSCRVRAILDEGSALFCEHTLPGSYGGFLCGKASRQPHARRAARLEQEAVVKPLPTYDRWTPSSRMHCHDRRSAGGLRSYPCGRLVLHASIGTLTGFSAASDCHDPAGLFAPRRDSTSTQRRMARDLSPIVRELGPRAARLAAPPHVIGLVQVVRGSEMTGRDAPAPA